MYTCKKCNTKIESHWKLCPECGAPVKREQEPSKSEESHDKTVKRASELYGAVRLDNIPEGYVIDDRYEIKRKLGQGGFGAVYLAFDRKMEVEKALKVIPEVVASDRESMKQLHREAKIMIKLNHPHIVRVYDFNDEGDIKYIDMEYVDGKTLTDLKLEHPDEKLPEAEVIRYAVKIAEAFEYAHKKDILHRDIKPQNVMVTSEGDIKVMDFGIAETVRSSMTRLTGVSSSGTLAYMSPEQLRGKEVGKESDVYSFGAMLYDLLSGHPPFYRGNIDYQVINEKPEKISGVSDWMNDILQKCLEKHYRNRYRDFRELAGLLNREQVTPVTHPDDTDTTEEINGEDDTVDNKTKSGIKIKNRYTIPLLALVGIIASGLFLYWLFIPAGSEKSTLITEKARFTISGTVMETGTGLAGVTLAVTGGYNQFVESNEYGNFQIAEVPQGARVTIKPSRSGFSFHPSSHTIDSLTQHITGISFTTSRDTYSISGKVTVDDSGIGGVTIRATGGHSQTVTSNSNGNYTITGIPHGVNVTITASRAGYSFSQTNRTINAISSNQTNQDFTVSAITYTLSGTVSGFVQSNVMITISGDHSATAQTEADGTYSITGIPHGSNITITPGRTGYIFSPPNRTHRSINSNQANQNFTGIKEGDVFNPATGKTWMDRNLGASRAATNSTDAQAYGHLYQWGRAADGHQGRTSGTTSTLSSSDSPGHSNFIIGSIDWRSPQNDNLWQGVNGINNPCPEGYRLPTEAEWDAERRSWGSNNSAGAFASPLKLPVAGARGYGAGSLSVVGSLGYYWSRSVAGTFSRYLRFFSTSAGMRSSYRADGYSVRCLKDDTSD